MKSKILELINEQTSPLFRIMSIHNDTELTRKTFDNNISAFHIGNGFVLSVAHNLRMESQFFKSITEEKFQQEILPKCNREEHVLLNRYYLLDPQTGKRYFQVPNQNEMKVVIDILRDIKCDTRWSTLYEEEICKPFLIVNFKENLYYRDSELTKLFSPTHTFPEPNINSHTFILELKIVKAFYSEDIALYKIVNTDQRIVDKLAKAEISFDFSMPNAPLYCLQGSPSGTNLGRMINEAKIEGILDHHAVEPDRIGGPVVREGLRYLLKGYFRFGSSGAPYFNYDENTNSFKANAIQSEASPIQLSIGGNKNGNFQYINAIASPLMLIQEELEREKILNL
jgi:hypothetical protein